MSADINVISRTQRIIVEAVSSSVAVINMGPPGFGDSGGSGGDGSESLVPPPVASGTPFQTFTDKYDDLCIAKGDVAGGIWKRAITALKFYCASAAYNAVAPVVAGGAASYDVYGLWANNNAFVVPVDGVYRIDWFVSSSLPANLRFIWSAWVNGAPPGNSNALTVVGPAAIYYNSFSVPMRVIAGDHLQVALNTGSGTTAGNGPLRISYESDLL